MPGIVHSFVNTFGDGTELDMVKPSDWNAQLEYSDADGAPTGVTASVRERLSGDRTYYVLTTGSDIANDGLSDSPAGAFQTWQVAYTTVRDALDFAGHTVTIQHGTESGAIFTDTIPINVSGGWVGGGSLVFDGINSADCTLQDSSVFGVIRTEGYIPGNLIIRNFKLTSPASGLIGHSAIGTMNITTGMDWGSAAGFQIISHNGGCPIYINGTNTISGGGLSHFLAAHGGVIFHEATTTTTITGTPAFGVAFAFAIDTGQVHSQGQAWTGSATGSRYGITTNGVINTAGGGANYFPGNSAGSAASGGQYA